MEILINGKTHTGQYQNGKLTIPINNDDLPYFQQWTSQKNHTSLKKDFVRNLDFINGHEKGTLCNCFPILNTNSDQAELVYDYSSIHMEFNCSPNHKESIRLTYEQAVTFAEWLEALTPADRISVHPSVRNLSVPELLDKWMHIVNREHIDKIKAFADGRNVKNPAEWE